MQKQRKMMGGMEAELKEKIAEMEEVNTAGRKLVDVKEFQRRKAKMQEETYMWFNFKDVAQITFSRYMGFLGFRF